jgi:hypothetical protein
MGDITIKISRILLYPFNPDGYSMNSASVKTVRDSGIRMFLEKQTRGIVPSF